MSFNDISDACPCGYSNEVSLVGPAENVTVSNPGSISDLRWLNKEEWDELRASQKRVIIVGEKADGESIQSLKRSDCAVRSTPGILV